MDQSGNAATLAVHHQPRQSALARAGRFIWHFVQMVLVMNAGMMVYHALQRTLFARIGIEAALEPYPAIRHILMDLAMVVPMVALMRYQRHSWRRNTEMVAAMMAGPVVFMLCLQFGLPEFHPWFSAKALKIVAEVSMYLGMLGVMLYRRNEHAHAAHGHGTRERARAPKAETTSHTTHAAHAPHQHEATPRNPKRVWPFIRHYLEMCAAMCIGTAALTPLFIWAAGQLGSSDPLNQLPELSVWVAAFNMTVPMAAWMRYRRMEWRPIVEMSAAMLVETILLVGAFRLGILSASSLVLWQHILMMPAMLIPMLYRRDVYAGHTGHVMHAG